MLYDNPVRTGRNEWSNRPPKTARIARRIWDMLTMIDGVEPGELWHNGNGIAWGHHLSDADYGAWKRDGGYAGMGEDVPEYVVIMAGATMDGMKMREWYAKFNPKGWEYYLPQIDKFKQDHPECRTYEVSKNG